MSPLHLIQRLGPRFFRAREREAKKAWEREAKNEQELSKKNRARKKKRKLALFPTLARLHWKPDFRAPSLTPWG
jgi:hypothetical protein